MFDKTYRVRAVHKGSGFNSYEDPLGQYGFVSVKITEVNNEDKYNEEYGQWIKFKYTADEGAVTELVATVARELIGRHVARYVAEVTVEPDGT